jgi:peptidyl-prolyl cis-trans isomerase SurA
VRQKLGPQVIVSERDIDMTIDKLAEQKGKRQYHVAEILLNVKNASDENNVRLKADALVKQIRGGERFSVVARDNSEAPGASAGGDMGWLQEGQMDAALEAALQKMHPGQISEPVRAGNGYHILFLREARDAGGALVEAQSASGGPVVLIKQILIPVNPKADTDTVIEAKRQRGIALKKEIKSCDALDKRAKDFPGKGTGTLGQAYEEKLPEPLKGIVKKLKVGALSEPIQAPGGWAMLMVCSREEEKAPAAETADAPAELDKTDEKARESIAGKLGSQRLGQMADHYLSDLRAAAFIDKRI